MTEIPQTPETQPESIPFDAISADDKKIAESAPVAKTDSVNVSRTAINYVVVAVVFFVAGLLIGSMSFSQPETTTASIDSATIEQAVQNVLVDAGIMQPPADMDQLVDDDPYLGVEDAPVVIVEFSAYACPYCGRHFSETLAPLLENYGDYVRYVYRDFPSINPNISFPAALAANCANEQGVFWDYHEQLFVNQTQLTQSGEAFLLQVAEDLGLDMDRFSTCLTQQDYLEEVNADFNTGVAVGVTGTPAFYINGQAHSGARPYEYFEQIILRELAEAGIDPDA